VKRQDKEREKRKKKEYLDINEEIHFVHKGPGKWMELYETKRDTKHSRMIVINNKHTLVLKKKN
jgi:hypothetical protein